MQITFQIGSSGVSNNVTLGETQRRQYESHYTPLGYIILTNARRGALWGVSAASEVFLMFSTQNIFMFMEL